MGKETRPTWRSSWRPSTPRWRPPPASRTTVALIILTILPPLPPLSCPEDTRTPVDRLRACSRGTLRVCALMLTSFCEVVVRKERAGNGYVAEGCFEGDKKIAVWQKKKNPREKKKKKKKKK